MSSAWVGPCSGEPPLVDADIGDDNQVEALIDDLTTFYITIRRGLTG